MDAKDGLFVFVLLLLSLGLFGSLSLTYCVWNKQTEVTSELQNELHSKIQSEVQNELKNVLQVPLNSRVHLGTKEASQVKGQLKRNVCQADENTNTPSATEILTNALIEIIEMRLMSYMVCNTDEYNQTNCTLRPGPKGEPGDTGPPGMKGMAGQRGERGLKGDMGSTGPKGDIGERGDKGQKGDIGPHGMKGVIGQRGPLGVKGDTGPEGPKGTKGNVGYQGEKGVAGSTGVGLPGAPGLPGRPGVPGVGPIGPQGPPGIQGRAGLKGERGQQGPTGEKGDTGHTGQKGERGDRGQKGEPGNKGARGNQGSKGEKGEQGPSGMTWSCGGTGGWRRVVFLNMTNTSHVCPTGLNLTTYSRRTCGQAHSGVLSCSSTTFSVGGSQYSRVCGRALAYRWSYNHGFVGYHRRRQGIEGSYVDGLSLTHGAPGSRQHIWTFASGVYTARDGLYIYHRCPCYNNNTFPSPPFVGNDYFCESVVTTQTSHNANGFTFVSNALLWDGQVCEGGGTCCKFNNPPWFTKNLTSPTTDSIELRLCTHNGHSSSDIALELLELYVQ